jgi:hypothetical protein
MLDTTFSLWVIFYGTLGGMGVAIAVAAVITVVTLRDAARVTG